MKSWGSLSSAKNIFKSLGKYESTANEGLYIIHIQTIEGGYNSGKAYYLNTSSDSCCEEWIQCLRIACEQARLNAEPGHIVRAQRRLRQFYESTRFQSLIAALIFLCFLANILQTEIQGPLASSAAPAYVFSSLEIFFTVVFALELVINFAANYLWPFIYDPWNWFDSVVVAVSLASLAVDFLPGVVALRFVRTLRQYNPPRARLLPCFERSLQSSSNVLNYSSFLTNSPKYDFSRWIWSLTGQDSRVQFAKACCLAVYALWSNAVLSDLAGRVMRLFIRLSSLRKIFAALSASVVPGNRPSTITHHSCSTNLSCI